MAYSEGPAPLFTYPSSRGTHRTLAAFMPAEPRFKSLHVKKKSDSFYSLPSTLKTSGSGFGTSTRNDWNTKMKKANPCAGPGSYRLPVAVGKQTLSESRSLPSISFGQAARAPASDNTTASPGPTYRVQSHIGDASAFGFGTSKRPALHGTADGPGPNINLKSTFRSKSKCQHETFGSAKKLQMPGKAVRTPGPIYSLECTGFRTGPSFSFSPTRRF